MQWTTQRGFGLLSALLLLSIVAVAATTVYATWGPVYEEHCTEPTAQEIDDGKEINELVSSPFGGEYKPPARCSRVIVR